jgi:hypothetical protein
MRYNKLSLRLSPSPLLKPIAAPFSKRILYARLCSGTTIGKPVAIDSIAVIEWAPGHTPTSAAL